MGMNAEIEAQITTLNRHRKHLPKTTITLMDDLVKADKQPDELQKDILYQAGQTLRRDLGDEEYFGRT